MFDQVVALLTMIAAFIAAAGSIWAAKAAQRALRPSFDVNVRIFEGDGSLGVYVTPNGPDPLFARDVATVDGKPRLWTYAGKPDAYGAPVPTAPQAVLTLDRTIDPTTPSGGVSFQYNHLSPPPKRWLDRSRSIRISLSTTSNRKRVIRKTIHI